MYRSILETHEQTIRARLERLYQNGCATLKELKMKGIESYILLDDWIAARFASEMISIREFLLVIKDAIESEAKLPNALVLDGVCVLYMR